MQTDHRDPRWGHNRGIGNKPEKVVLLVIKPLQDQQVEGANTDQAGPDKDVNDKWQDQVPVDPDRQNRRRPSHKIGERDYDYLDRQSIERLHQTDIENIEDHFGPGQHRNGQTANAEQQHRNA